MLEKCLTVPPNQPVFLRDGGKIRCKQSMRDVTTTIENEIEKRPSDDEIKSAILESICSLTECNFEKGELTEEEIEVAQSLYQNQYSKDEWNLGILVEE